MKFMQISNRPNLNPVYLRPDFPPQLYTSPFKKKRSGFIKPSQNWYQKLSRCFLVQFNCTVVSTEFTLDIIIKGTLLVKCRQFQNNIYGSRKSSLILIIKKINQCHRICLENLEISLYLFFHFCHGFATVLPHTLLRQMIFFNLII